MVPWESWIYVDLQGGIEITFTDELANGIYDYAPAPMGSDIPVKQLAALTRTNPSVVAEKAMRGAPNHYVSPENKLPLGLYYDLATFRGKTDGETLVEVSDVNCFSGLATIRSPGGWCGVGFGVEVEGLG